MNDLPKMFVHHIARHPTGMYGVWMNAEQLPCGVTLQPDDLFLLPGIYNCHKDYYHEGKYETFEIEVKGHTRVLFHKGNWKKNSKLCILIAEKYEPILDSVERKVVPGIAQSEEGFTEFWHFYQKYQNFQLVVTAKEGLI